MRRSPLLLDSANRISDTDITNVVHRLDDGVNCHLFIHNVEFVRGAQVGEVTHHSVGVIVAPQLVAFVMEGLHHWVVAVLHLLFRHLVGHSVGRGYVFFTEVRRNQSHHLVQHPLSIGLKLSCLVQMIRGLFVIG